MKNTAHDPRAIANIFIEYAATDGKHFTMMQLIKLVYIAHGFSLAALNAPLINQPVQAWQHGPVISSLYQALKAYGSRPVTEPISDPRYGVVRAELSLKQHRVVRAVYKTYGHLSAFELSGLTHKVGTPWHKRFEPGKLNVEIPDSLIQSYYKELSTAA